jgi:hypothetical protein
MLNIDKTWTEYVRKNKFGDNTNGKCRLIVFIIQSIFLTPLILMVFLSGLLVLFKNKKNIFPSKLALFILAFGGIPFITAARIITYLTNRPKKIPSPEEQIPEPEHQPYIFHHPTQTQNEKTEEKIIPQENKSSPEAVQHDDTITVNKRINVERLPPPSRLTINERPTINQIRILETDNEEKPIASFNKNRISFDDKPKAMGFQTVKFNPSDHQKMKPKYVKNKKGELRLP